MDALPSILKGSLFCLGLLFSVSSSAQSDLWSLNLNANRLYIDQDVDERPEFPGGKKEMATFIDDNLVYPLKAREQIIEGIVKVAFTIDPDGSIQDPEIIESLGFGCDEEAMHLIRIMPNWEPGVKNRSKVSTRLVLSVNFSLE